MTNEIILLKEDVQLLTSYIKGGNHLNLFDQKNAEKLKEELTKGTVLSKEEFPLDVIRLNSTVTIQDHRTGKLIHLMLVLPEKAAINDGKVSVLAPIGTALIGYRKGQTVNWKMPAGEKVYKVMEVVNEAFA